MKPPRAYVRGILHFFGEIRRSMLNSLGYGGSAIRIHPWVYGSTLLTILSTSKDAHGILRKRIKM